MSLANVYGADRVSVLDGWQHPEQQPRKPKTVMLYGREWSAADAAYARELAADDSIPTADLARLWATNRPSVRSESVKSEPECKAEPLPKCKAEPAPTLHPDAGPVVEPFTGPNDFERWLAASGLSVAKAAERFGVSRPTIYAWRQKGAPAEVMARLSAC